MTTLKTRLHNIYTGKSPSARSETLPKSAIPERI